MEYSVEALAALAARHAPVFHLHPSDRFMPCTVEFFMAHSTLVALGPAPAASGCEDAAAGRHVRRRELLPRGFVTAEALLEAQAAHPPPTRLRLDLHPAARPGTPPDQIDDVPLYVHIKEVVSPPPLPGDGGSSEPAVEALEINYLTFYAYNGPYNVGGLRLVQTGDHDGDWEHITARVHPATGELLGMWYNAHRSRDGMWVEPARLPRSKEGRPLAYVALHGHGTYPMPGTIPRHFFLGNDKCSGKGLVWRSRTLVLLPPMHEEHAAPVAQHDTVQLDQAVSSRSIEAGNGGGIEAEDSLGQPADVNGASTAEADALAEQAAALAIADVGHLPAAAPPKPPLRRLHRAHSRGSSLGGGSSSEGGSLPGPPFLRVLEEGPGGEGTLPRVVIDDPCRWVFFRGEWGQTDAPIIQPWFHTAEPPVSRTTLLRLFGHFWPERDCI